MPKTTEKKPLTAARRTALRAYMDRKKLTYQALASRLGCSQSTVSRLMSGTPVGVHTLQRVKDFLALHAKEVNQPAAQPAAQPGLLAILKGAGGGSMSADDATRLARVEDKLDRLLAWAEAHQAEWRQLWLGGVTDVEH